MAFTDASVPLIELTLAQTNGQFAFDTKPPLPAAAVALVLSVSVMVPSTVVTFDDVTPPRISMTAAPDPAEASKVEAAMLIHDAGLDDRVNRTSFPWVKALRASGKKVKFYLYEGVNHAFNNDTSAERYDKAAADLAWQRTLAFFHAHLA